MIHPWHDVTPGDKLPQEFQSVIEIPFGSSVKYELDKTSGLIKLDRILYSAVYYPANYGYVPMTIADDEDPVDVLVHTPFPLLPGVVVRCRALGVLQMEDEAGGDAKLLAVPSDDICPLFMNWQDIEDVPDARRQQIQHFFEHYKDLEPGKWVKILRWGGPEDAQKLILEGIEREKKKKA